MPERPFLIATEVAPAVLGGVARSLNAGAAIPDRDLVHQLEPDDLFGFSSLNAQAVIPNRDILPLPENSPEKVSMPKRPLLIATLVAWAVPAFATGDVSMPERPFLIATPGPWERVPYGSHQSLNAGAAIPDRDLTLPPSLTFTTLA